MPVHFLWCLHSEAFVLFWVFPLGSVDKKSRWERRRRTSQMSEVPPPCFSSPPPVLSGRWWPGWSTGRPLTGLSSSPSWPTVSSWPWMTNCPTTTSPSCPSNWWVQVDVISYLVRVLSQLWQILLSMFIPGNCQQMHYNAIMAKWQKSHFYNIAAPLSPPSKLIRH